jgi:8-oxo-dGTP pyrophosphatase MutT (NUDIX family)
MEYLFLVDERNKPITSKTRAESIEQHFWRRASGGLVIDYARRSVLCHRRSMQKDERPGYWVATFGGKVHTNESVRAAARRELFEEFSIDLLSKDFLFVKKYRSVERRQFEYVFCVQCDSQNVTPTPQASEVDEWRWMDYQLVQNSFKKDKLWYYYGYEKLIFSQVFSLLNKK